MILNEALQALVDAGYTVTARVPEGRFDGFVGPAAGQTVVIPYTVELTISNEKD